MRKYTIDDVKYTIGQNIKNARIAKGITQLELAGLAGMRRDKSGSSSICNIENGSHFPQPRNITRIANALNVDVFDLFKKLD